MRLAKPNVVARVFFWLSFKPMQPFLAGWVRRCRITRVHKRTFYAVNLRALQMKERGHRILRWEGLPTTSLLVSLENFDFVRR